MTRFLFLKKIFNSFLRITLFTLPFKYLFSQSAQSSLEDPALLNRFQDISSDLRCVCGKTMPLNYINDIGHCNAWAMRSVIDGLLSDGFSDQKIRDGFLLGFGDLVDTHFAFRLTHSKYSYLLDGMRNGYGEEILSSVSLPISTIGIVSFVTTSLGALFFFLKRNIRSVQNNNLDTEQDTSSIEEGSFELTEYEQKLLDKLEKE